MELIKVMEQVAMIHGVDGDNILGCEKGKEHYVFVYDDSSYQELIETLCRYAADSKLSLSLG